MSVDPDGQWSLAVRAAAVGAAIAGGVELFLQLQSNDWQYECVDWYQVGGSAAVGGIVGAITGPLASAVAGVRYKGQELVFQNGVRIAPVGNRRIGDQVNHWHRRLPHYHRSVKDPVTGLGKENQGIGRHRPWETRSGPRPPETRKGSFWERF